MFTSVLLVSTRIKLMFFVLCVLGAYSGVFGRMWSVEYKLSFGLFNVGCLQRGLEYIGYIG